MLKNIKIRNFGSIGEEQEMSLEITAKDVLNDSAIPIEEKNALNLVSSVIGPNASGKTTLLKAITFLFWLIEDAYRTQKIEEDLPLDSHKLKRHEPTNIEIKFINKEGTLYKYSIELTKKEILKEFLSKKTKRMSKVFQLNRHNGNTTIQVNGFKINEADEKRFKERHNVPLLSSLIDTGYLPEISFFKKFKSNANGGIIHESSVFSSFNISQEIYKDETLRKAILDFSKNIDLGISNLNFKEIIFTDKGNAEGGKIQILQCVHKSNNTQFELPIFEESNGTQRAFLILSEVFQILKMGGLAVIDEIESGLHPDIARKIIFLFENKKTNPSNAQLIFSTHQHLLLNDRSKTQIFIAERNNKNFETEIYRLDDVEGVRNDENYFHKYIAGAYGGTPKINWR